MVRVCCKASAAGRRAARQVSGLSQTGPVQISKYTMNGAWASGSPAPAAKESGGSFFNFFGASNEEQKAPAQAPKPMRGAMVTPESMPINLASYRRLCHVQENQLAAKEAKEEREERRQFASVYARACLISSSCLCVTARVWGREHMRPCGACPE